MRESHVMVWSVDGELLQLTGSPSPPPQPTPATEFWGLKPLPLGGAVFTRCTSVSFSLGITFTDGSCIVLTQYPEAEQGRSTFPNRRTP
jgi:hypothetical protein